MRSQAIRWKSRPLRRCTVRTHSAGKPSIPRMLTCALELADTDCVHFVAGSVLIFVLNRPDLFLVSGH